MEGMMTVQMEVSRDLNRSWISMEGMMAIQMEVSRDFKRVLCILYLVSCNIIF